MFDTRQLAQKFTSRITTTSAGLLVAFVLQLTVATARAADQPPVTGKVQVHPETLRLVHHRYDHSLLITGRTADGSAVDLTAHAKLRSADESITKIVDGWVKPLKSGTTKIIIEVAGQAVEVPVESVLSDAEKPYSFRHEVMPVLSKGGCNMGACHGYSLGKNGFKLSLRGGDAKQDIVAINADNFGRRVNLLKPTESLLLTKPLGDVPHRGGVRFARNSELHQTLERWVTQGAKGDMDDKNEVEFVRIHPERFVLEPGSPHRLQLIAHYTDGTTRDVTRQAIFTVNTEGVADVNDVGHVVAKEMGESAIVARFERKFAASRLIVLKPRPSFQPTPAPADNFIDQHVIAKLNDLKITPSELANDEDFLRRVSLDLIGLQPTPEDVRKFVADVDATKRTKKIEELFTRPEFVDHWSLKWGDLLQNSRVRVSEPALYSFREWIRSSVASNQPIDEMARELLVSRGGQADNPASAYYLISKDTNETIERVAQVFCGVRMLCARCHTHPLENWTQEDYYGLHTFFNQVSAKNDPRFVNVPNARAVTLNVAAGFSTNPRSGQAQPPRYLGGAEPKLEPNKDRRADFAKWLTTPDNPLFARSLANRYWSYFFHRGIIDPVDDLRTTNPPINPELLDALTKDFIDNKFDARHLMRRIVTSQTYQRSSAPNDTNKHDVLNFSRAIPRRIPAEALLDSLVQATAVRENFGGAPAGFTAAQLPDAEVTSDFLSLFGKPQRSEACECERDGESNMLQALHLINGNSILRRVTDGNGRVAQLLRQNLADEALIEELYLWSLSRRPTSRELTVAQQHLQTYGPQQKTEAVQDLMWSLLNSRDFVLVR